MLADIAKPGELCQLPSRTGCRVGNGQQEKGKPGMAESITEYRARKAVLSVEHDGDFFAGCRAFSTSYLPEGFGSPAYRAGYEWQARDYQRQIEGIAPDGRAYGESL